MKAPLLKLTALTSLVMISLCGATLAANYDGHYNAQADGSVDCPAIPPYVPATHTYAPPMPFTFFIRNGIVSGAGTIDNFGHIFYQVPAGGATATVTGTMSYTGYVTNGRISISGLPGGCTAGGAWSAQPAGPKPTSAPPLSQFPAPPALFSSINNFIRTTPGFDPDNTVYLKDLVSETASLTTSGIGTFLKSTSGPTATAIHTICTEAGLIEASAAGGLRNFATASFAALLPYLPFSEQGKEALEGELLIKSLVDISKLGAEEQPYALALEAVLQIYDKGVAPALQQVADDPPDPDYTMVASINPIKVPNLPSTGKPALDAFFYKSYYDVLLAQAHLNAMNTAFNRYSSAYSAGDEKSAGLQLGALLDNLSRYNREMLDATADLKDLKALLQSSGSADRTFNPQGLTDLKNYIIANGVPSSVMDALTLCGFTTTQIESARTQLLTANPQFSQSWFTLVDNVSNNARNATSNPSPQLYNISTRGFVGTGDNILDGGFIVEGADSKTVMIRAIGPGLTQYGVTGALADPILELHNVNRDVIASNDDWQSTIVGGMIQGSQVAGVQNTGNLIPSDTKESVIIVTLPPGDYTAVMHGKNNTTGVGLVEVYDLSPGSNSLLHNLSTRGLVQTGDSVMIGGFIVKGTGPRRVIIRAIGPELTQYNVPNALANPTLELHDGKGVLIGINDDWQTTVLGGIITSNQVQDIQNSGHTPGDARESAIVATLQPGNYTAIIRGVGNTTGIALVEVYDLQ